MRLYLAIGAIFLIIYFISPPVFNMIGKIVDTPRCFIGMTHYCDRAPTPDIRNLSK
jgi:hypothetical protein